MAAIAGLGGGARLFRAGSSHDPSVQLKDVCIDATELALCNQLRARVADAGARAGEGTGAGALPASRPDQLVRFLRARDGDVDKACEMLSKHLAFRAKLPLLRGEVQEELRKNKIVLYGKCREGRHVVVVRTRLMGKHTYDDLDTCQVALVLLAEYLESILAPTEKITVIFSRKESQRANLDLDWVKMCAEVFQNNYPERLHRATVSPINLLFRSIWSVAQLFFDPKTREKIVLGAGDQSFLEVVAQPADLPVELGGTSKAPLDCGPVLEWLATRQKALAQPAAMPRPKASPQQPLFKLLEQVDEAKEDE
jgi:hypothetical protein